MDAPEHTALAKPEGATATIIRLPASIRGDSAVRAGFAAANGTTHLADLFEQGSLRMRLPRHATACEAVLINTGGGIIGGDSLDISVSLAAGAHVVATTQAAEKIYRAEAEPARLAVKLALGSGARLDWLPQETILFGHAACERRLDVEMAADARLTLVEMLVLGRIARGEVVSRGRWRDRWRIRRGGRLVFADEVRLEGAVAETMARPALGGGARAIATLVHIAPDAPGRLDAVRDCLAGSRSDCGASAWDGMLVARFASEDPQALRAGVIDAVTAIRNEEMPRTWFC